MKRPRDPFASRKPMADNHPVMEYLDWQIACHQEQMEHLSGGWMDSTIDRLKKDLSEYDPKDGFPFSGRYFEGFEYAAGEMKRIGDQLSRLKRERLRFKKDVDFRGNGNYLM